MNFLAPLSLFLSVMAIPIILLYMLRLRRREVQVSSTMLWQQVIRDKEANAPWQKLRRNLLLLLQLLILAALVVALARPYTEVPTVTRGRTALLLDASASMNATDVQPSRFEAAKSEALNIVNTLGEGDTLAIIRVAQAPEMVASYTDDRESLRTAITGMQPSTAGADWNAALTLAAAGAQGAERFNIVLISDGGVQQNAASGAYGDVRFIPIGASDSNLAISALSTANDQVQGPQIYARITNYGVQPADVVFSITLDGTLFNASPYTVQGNGYVDIVVSKLPESFQRVEAKLTRPAGSTQPDYLALDDVAWTVYNPGKAGRAVLMSRGNRFLEQGFSSLPEWQSFRGDITRGMPSDKYDLYVFDGWLPNILPDANMLIVNPPANIPAVTGDGQPLFKVEGQIDKPQITGVKADDPRTRYLSFNDVNVLKFKALSGATWADTLISANNTPLILAGEYNGRRIAIFAFDLFDSDLPLKIAWPILLADLTEWYKAPRALRIENSLQPGNTLAIYPLNDTTTIRVNRPDGATTTLDVNQAVMIYADTPLIGVYGVDLYAGDQLSTQEYFAVNLFDANESNITVRTPTLGAGSVTAAAQEEIGQQEFWPWVALLALLILAGEWYAYHRRVGAPRLRVGDAVGPRFGQRKA